LRESSRGVDETKQKDKVEETKRAAALHSIEAGGQRIRNAEASVRRRHLSSSARRERFGLGRLRCDITFERGDFRVYILITDADRHAEARILAFQAIIRRSECRDPRPRCL
jgi:hypothetical protein